MTAAELADLRRARLLLEHPGLAMKLTSVLGTSLEKGFSLLPQAVSDTVNGLSRRALEAAVRSAIMTMQADRHRPQAADSLHRLMVAGTGAAGGFWGIPALAVELPLTTTIMMRSIADIARSEGHPITDPAIRGACIEVFALGGPGKNDNGAETGYYAVRAGLAQALSDAAGHLAGKGLANPLASIWSVSQMLDFFGQPEWGAKVIAAIETLLVEKKTLTPDLGGLAKTKDIAPAILEILKRK